MTWGRSTVVRMPGAGRADHGHGVDGPVGRVAGRGLAHALERDGEAQLDVERARRRRPRPASRWRRRSQAGSRSVVQYQLARNARSGSARRACRRPRMRWAATVPASRRPAAMSSRAVGPRRPRRWPRPSRAAATSASATSRSVGRSSAAPWAQRPGSKRAGVGPEAHEVEQQRRASRAGTGRRTPRCCRRSSRRWIEVSTTGTASEMKPGLLPGAVDRGAALPDRPPRSASRISGSRLAGWWNSPRVVTMLAPDASRRHTSSKSQRLRHVQHAVGAEGQDRRRCRRWPSTPVGAVPHSSPASRPALSGEYT